MSQVESSTFVLLFSMARQSYQCDCRVVFGDFFGSLRNSMRNAKSCVEGHSHTCVKNMHRTIYM